MIDWVRLHRNLARSQGGPVERALGASLVPFSVAYGFLARLRGSLMPRLLAGRELGLPSVVVGGIEAGGGGKTPFAAFVARMFHSAGERPLLVSHGYGGRIRRAEAIVVSRGDGRFLSGWSRVGEEAILLAKAAPEVPVVAVRRRALAARAARQMGIEASCVVFDGGMQDLRLRPSLLLAMVDATIGPAKRRLLPRGELREPLSALRRADVVVLSRADLAVSTGGRREWLEALERLGLAERTVEVAFEWDRPELLGTKVSGLAADWTAVSSLRLLLYCGIAHPESFELQARGHGLQIRGSLWAPDHARPRAKLVSRLREEAERVGADAVLTTQKDAIKLEEHLSSLPPLVIARQRVRILSGRQTLERALGSLFDSI